MKKYELALYLHTDKITMFFLQLFYQSITMKAIIYQMSDARGCTDKDIWWITFKSRSFHHPLNDTKVHDVDKKSILGPQIYTKCPPLEFLQVLANPRKMFTIRLQVPVHTRVRVRVHVIFSYSIHFSFMNTMLHEFGLVIVRKTHSCCVYFWNR